MKKLIFLLSLIAQVGLAANVPHVTYREVLPSDSPEQLRKDFHEKNIIPIYRAEKPSVLDRAARDLWQLFSIGNAYGAGRFLFFSPGASYANGGSVAFNGSTSYVEMSFYAPPANFSVVCWAYQSSTSTNPAIMSQWSASTSERAWIIGADGSTNLLILLSSGGTGVTKQYVSNGSAVFSAAWKEVAFTYAGGSDTLTLYAAGSSQSVTKTTDTSMSQIFNTGSAHTAQGVVIKNGAGSIASYWNGKITHCSTWSVALSGSEITETISGGVPANLNNHSQYANLTHWWQDGNLNDTTSTIYDYRGSMNGTGNNITLDASHP